MKPGTSLHDANATAPPHLRRFIYERMLFN